MEIISEIFFSLTCLHSLEAGLREFESDNVRIRLMKYGNLCLGISWDLVMSLALMSGGLLQKGMAA